MKIKSPLERGIWSCSLKLKKTVKFHSEAKDNCEISFWWQRQLWNFIHRPRAAVKCQCNKCTDLTNLRIAALQETGLCIKYSRLVPNVTDSVTYGHHGFSFKNRNKIVWIYGILKCMNLSYMQKCFNDVRILSLKCFSYLSISDKCASEWVSVSWTISIFCIENNILIPYFFMPYGWPYLMYWLNSPRLADSCRTLKLGFL